MTGSMTFTRSTILCLQKRDGEEVEIEVDGVYRAIYDRDWRGRLTSIRIERDESRKPDIENWQPTVLEAKEVREIVEFLDDEYEEEEDRIARLALEEACLAPAERRLSQKGAQ